MKRNTLVTRSQYFYNLVVPKFRSNFGRRSFSHAAAVEWNKFSFDLKLIPSKILFRQKLKTYLFFQFSCTVEILNDALTNNNNNYFYFERNF